MQAFLFKKQKNEEIMMDKIVRYKESTIRKKEIGHSKSIDCGYDLLQSGFNGFAIPGRFGLGIEEKNRLAGGFELGRSVEIFDRHVLPGIGKIPSKTGHTLLREG